METVTVHLPQKLTSIDQAHKVVANVLAKLGCPGCLSGFDIRFTHAIDVVVNPKTLEAQILGH